MSASTTWQYRPPIGLAEDGSRVAADVTGGAGRRALRRLLGVLDDAMFLVLAVLLIPVAVLVIGIPIALLVGVVSEISHGVFRGLLTTAAPVIGVSAAALFLVRHLLRR